MLCKLDLEFDDHVNLGFLLMLRDVVLGRNGAGG